MLRLMLMSGIFAGAGLNIGLFFFNEFLPANTDFPRCRYMDRGGLSGHVVCGRRSCAEVSKPQSGRLIAET